ncbi:MAG: hypothetical protein HYW25_04275 [Candidatus Aenigmarchaeota archaeon]|nr:hypothetical protein [Candidatus Aenigmarchaeota archaeon]
MEGQTLAVEGRLRRGLEYFRRMYPDLPEEPGVQGYVWYTNLDPYDDPRRPAMGWAPLEIATWVLKRLRGELIPVLDSDIAEYCAERLGVTADHILVRNATIKRGDKAVYVKED